MEKPGTKNMWVGIGIFVLGAIISGVTYSVADPGGSYILAWGPMLFGGISFVFGLFQYIAFSLKGERGKAIHYAEIELQAIARSMIHQALSDGHLSKDELTMIRLLIANYIEEVIEEETLYNLANQAKNGEYDFIEHITEIRKQVSYPARVMIVRMSYLVSLSDGVVDDDEVAKLLEISKALKVHSDDAVQAIEDVKKSFDGDLDQAADQQAAKPKKKKKHTLVQ